MDDLEFLRSHAPASQKPGADTIAQARRALEARIHAAAATHPARGRGRRYAWRWIGAAAAAAVAVAAVGAYALIGGVDRPDTAAAAVLHTAAVTARSQPGPAPLAVGQYQYVKSEGVQLASALLANGSTVNSRSSIVREVWMGAHSRVRETVGNPEFVTEKDRQTWIDAGRPTFIQPGAFREDLDPYKPLDLPTDPAILYAKLKLQAVGHGTGIYNEMFVLVGDDLRETATLPAVRAALYEVAARIPGVELVGDVTDSAGRHGVAVAMIDAKSHTRQVLILDPRTSRLLGEEETVTAGNQFGWPDGTLMGRTTYLLSAVVGSNTALPARATSTATDE